MNVAYPSTATAIGSCSSYSRFTISGGLLMIDMCFSFFLFVLLLLSRHGQNTGRTAVLAVRWAGATATVSVATKWGRSSPVLGFARVQNQWSRRVQRQRSEQLSFTTEVNGTVNDGVNRVFHAPFTPSRCLLSR